MELIDFGVAWEWEFDKDFVNVMARECSADSIRFFAINPKNFEEVKRNVEEGKMAFLAYLDRAGDIHEPFAQFAEKIRSRGTWLLNRFSDVERSRDKATMHLEFLTKGLRVPFTVILSPYDKDPELRISELEKLGRPFIIKPACGGGGIGVVMGAENLHDVIEVRKEFRQDKYLLQRKIMPKYLENRRAWFRSFYICGTVVSCWWDDQTHIYEVLTPEQNENYKLGKLKDVTKAISEVCGLSFFSTEIAIDNDGQFIVVDYVNEPCDMRIKSVYPDGVPDEIVLEIVKALLAGVKKEIKKTRKNFAEGNKRRS